MNNTNIKCMASLCIRMNPKRHTQASFTIERTCRLKDSYTCSEYASYKERTSTYINNKKLTKNLESNVDQVSHVSTSIEVN